MSWESYKLIEICNVKTGKYDANHADKKGKYNFFTCADIPSKCNTYSFEGEKIILPGNGANVGKVYFHNGKSEAYQRTYILINFKLNTTPKFIYWHLKHFWENINKNLQYGSATNYIRMSNFENYNIELPPLPEQQRIADILDKAEAINQKREKALLLCDEFLRATFLDMFGDPVSNPKGWEVEKLESFILHMNNGLSRRRKVQENVGGIVLRLQDIQYDGIGFDKELNRVELDEDEKKRYELLVGDILFVRVNGNPDYVGRSAIFNGYQEPVFHNDHLIRIRLNEKLLPEYLVFLLHSDIENNLISQQIKTSAGQHTISQKGINNIEIPIPSVELQQEFIAVVEKVNAIKAKINSAQELPLFDALSQKAFKGELTQ